MRKQILSIAIDAGMAALLYFGVFNGNTYALNAFWAVFWVFIVITVLIILVLSVGASKEEFKKTRKPRPNVMVRYSFIYDTCFALALASLGFLWSGAIWWLLQLFAGALISSVDDELRKETEKCD